MTEEWREIPGTLGCYEASNLGRIRSTSPTRGRILKQSGTTDGYLRVTISVDAEKTNRRSHQLIAAAFLGECPRGEEVRHLDGDRCNNSVDNLRYGTKSENQQDCLEHGTHAQLRKTRCPQDHPYTPENTRIRISRAGAVSRLCRACHRESVKRAKRAKRSGVLVGAGK